jgi:hypothetical protein
MSYPRIVRLPIELGLVLEAINRIKNLISLHYGSIVASLEGSFQKPFLDEMENKIEPLNRVEQFLKERINSQSNFLIFEDGSTYRFVMDIILSSLEVYRRKLESIQKEHNVKVYNPILNTINDLLEEAKSGEKKDLFLEYYDSGIEEQEKKAIKLFISYQQDDVKVACNIQDLIVKSSTLKKDEVFVAHRDIPLSEEWRKEMIAQLDSSTHLLALCTNSYINSPFGNQEVGYAIAKNIKITPIFWEGTNRSYFGFLEGFQALPEFANKINLELLVKEILRRFEIS